MNADIKRVIAGLRNFRTRSAALEELVDAGAEAVEPLIEALNDRSEGVRWSAIKCLGLIGDPRAVRPLIDLLGDEDCAEAAAAALEQIAGVSFGRDEPAWRRWAAQYGSSEQALPSAVNPDDLVKQAFDSSDAQVEQRENSWKITLPVRDGRKQVVRILLGKKDSDGAPLVVAYTECGPAEPARFEWALRKNLSIPHGALGVHDVRGEPTFVMFRTLLCDATPPEELRRVVTSIAQKADSIEKELTQADER